MVEITLFSINADLDGHKVPEKLLKGKVLAPKKLEEANKSLRRLKDVLPK